MQPDLTPPARALFILNPVSGVTSAEAVLALVQQRFSAAGWELRTYTTQGNESLKPVVAEALDWGAQLVVVSGGDGTVSGAADGLVGTSVPLGVLPAGTWNALSRNLGIPLQLETALELILGEHSLRRLDGLSIAGRLYLLNAGAGISSTLIQTTDRQQKRRFGFLAYLLNFFRSLIGLQPHAFTLQIDDLPVRTRASEIMIVNSSVIGLGELPTPLNIYPDDGLMEVCVLRSRTLVDLLRVAWDVVISRRDRSPRLRTYRAARRIWVSASKPLVAQADGEIIGQTPFEAFVVPGAVCLIVPSAASRQGIELFREQIRALAERTFTVRSIRSAVGSGNARPEA
ncbi:diacylglycerol/lipid kinase family protein [Levilinea saccharolytica]|uniref:DAGKc domain-containing protein n=1 Tax=Levilinea saccharolytica TaxID=229921 RepID=A0A0P6X378_9CHLR|nr:diacylglycerol kinase family protein [Levilinea saccharolytica]KPL75589.1 hypothetical protein ADN01_17190 [Levilinea saccharolytica]